MSSILKRIQRFRGWIFRLQVTRNWQNFHLRAKRDPVSETSCPFQNSRRWTKSSNPVVLIVIYHGQNPLELIPHAMFLQRILDCQLYYSSSCLPKDFICASYNKPDILNSSSSESSRSLTHVCACYYRPLDRSTSRLLANRCLLGLHSL